MREATLGQRMRDQLGDVAELMLAEIDDLVAEMDANELEMVPVFGADATIRAEFSASNRANVRHLLTAMAQRQDRMGPIDPPPEAMDIVRTVVRRRLDFEVLFQAYRRGQNVALQRFMAHATRVVPGPELGEFLQTSSQLLFAYVDHVLSRIIAESQREREEILGGALARRTETVRLILDNAPIESRRASERLGYSLDQFHTALVLWVDEPGEVQGTLEFAAVTIARAVGARSWVTMPAGTNALWAWLGSEQVLGLGSLASTMRSMPSTIRVASGRSRAGIAGFRRTHEDALAIQSVLARQPGGPRLGLHRDFEVTALAAHDRGRAAEFVATTLGDLAADTPVAARLRETLRTYLDEAENAPRTAERLHTHRNTILYRVSRAEVLLGHPAGEHRLAVMLALELAHHLGRPVLKH